VDALSFEGNTQIGADELTGKIATRESPRFLGLFPGVVYDYQVLNPYVLELDLERIQRYYRARGFYEAQVLAARVIRRDQRRVEVRIRISEGPAVTVRQLAIRGLATLPERLREPLQAAALEHLAPGTRLEEAQYHAAQAAIQRGLTENAYANAQVDRAARVDLAHESATVSYQLQPHRPAVFGPVRYAGLSGIPEGPVKRAVDIRPGDAYSSEALDLARQAALELGVFSSVVVEPELQGAGQSVVPIHVDGRPAPLRTLRFGAGVRLDSVGADVHVLAAWQNRNFLGGLRRLSFELNPSLVLFGTRLPEFSPPEQLLPQLEARAELRQPGLFEPRTNGLLRVDYGIRAVLDRNTGNGENILGYREARGGLGLERRFGHYLYLRPSLNLQLNTPFVYAGSLDVDLNPRLLISYFELLANLDLRDSPVRPHRGIYLSTQPQVALLADAHDIRLSQELRGYVPLARRATLALRGNLGFLFPFSYGEPAPGDVRRNRVRDAQLIYFRGFFSGGTSSNRGYPVRGIGPHDVIDFSYPVTGTSNRDCSRESSDERCELPIGGVSLWELSGELRFDVTGPLGVNLFCDASDVSPSRLDVRLNRPHLSCGPGVRYDTPVGPLRADLGVRVPGLQILAGGVDVEGSPPTLLGLPVALAVGIGEAF
jgi:outer membrane protein assembly factor BamA